MDHIAGPPSAGGFGRIQASALFCSACHSSGEDNHYKTAFGSVTSSRDRALAGQCRGEKCTLIPPTRFRLPIPSSRMGLFLVTSGNRPIALFPVQGFPSFSLFRPGRAIKDLSRLSWGALSCSPRCCHGHRRRDAHLPRVSQSGFQCTSRHSDVNSKMTPLACLAFYMAGDCCLCNQPSSAALFAHASAKEWHWSGTAIVQPSHQRWALVPFIVVQSGFRFNSLALLVTDLGSMPTWADAEFMSMSS